MSDDNSPHSVGRVITQGVSLGASRIVPLFIVYMGLSLPGLLMGAAQMYAGPHPGGWIVMSTIMADLLNLFLMVIASGITMLVLHNAATQSPRTTRQSIHQVLSRSGPLLLLWLSASVVIGIAFLLLIVPGVYLGVMLSMALFPVVLEHQGPIDSIAASYRMVKGNWWHVATATGLTALAAFILYLTAIIGVSWGYIAMMGAPKGAASASVAPLLSLGLVLAAIKSALTVLASGVLVAAYRNVQARNAVNRESVDTLRLPA